MTATTAVLEQIIARKNELRAAERAIIDNPLYQNWESQEFPELEAELIEIQNKIKEFYNSDEYINAVIKPLAAAAAINDCYGGI